MSDLLVYWKDFWHDVETAHEAGFDWQTKDQRFYDKVRRGDALWVVITGGKDNPSSWRLLQKVVVHSKRIEPSRHGKYCLVADKRSSQMWHPNSQPDLTAILWALKFPHGKGIGDLGRTIGLKLRSSFRILSAHDAILLDDYSRKLKKIR